MGYRLKIFEKDGGRLDQGKQIICQDFLKYGKVFKKPARTWCPDKVSLNTSPKGC